MAQISKNGFDLIGSALHKLKGKGAKAFLGTLTFVLPLALLCCIPYAGWAIALFCFGVLNTGYIRFMRELMNGENPKLSRIFSEVKTGWFELYLGALLLAMFILGTAVLFLPGILLIGYYSLSLYTAEYFHIEKLSEVFYQTAVRMDGNKTTMFSFKSLFYFAYVLILASYVLVGYGIYLLWAINPVLAVLVAVLAFLVFVVLWSCVTMYFHATNEVFFQEVLTKYELKEAKAKAKAAEKLEQPAAEATPVAEQPEEVKPEPAKKAAPKKAPAKAPAKKSAAPKAKASKPEQK